MTKKQFAANKLKLDRIQEAVQPLVGLPQFEEFVELLRDLKDEAVANSVSFETSASERNSLVAKGEILAYLNILGVCDGQKEQFDNYAQSQAELSRVSAE